MVMFGVIHFVHARWSFAASLVGRINDIAASVALGICVYAATIAIFWILRPDAESAEAIVIGRFREWVKASGLSTRG